MAMNPLLAKLKKSSTSKHADIMGESDFFNEKNSVVTEIPILNLALSGSLKSGLASGLTVVAAPSKSFKSNLSLFMVSAYMKKYPESVCLFYDSEFGSPPSYLDSFDIDINRVFHTPVATVEELRSDLTIQLDNIERGDKVIIFIDSIGNLASKKETIDALEQKEKADMTRAKTIKSLFRIVTPQLTLKDIPCICINHTIETMEMFSKTVMTGGTGILYSASTVLFITKAQEKDGTDLAGFKFTMIAEKSRAVREKSKFPLSVTFENGINKFSGLLDLAVELGAVEKPKQGWYSRVIKGKLEDKCWRAKDTNSNEFWDPILNDPEFEKLCNKRFKLSRGDSNSIVTEDLDDEIEIDEVDF
jgi:RecA/RadA recombinase